MTEQEEAISALIRLHVRYILDVNKAANDRGMLPMWTIYDHPRDYPDGFIARRSETGGGQPAPVITDDVIPGELARIRECMQRCGLVCLTRDPSDDPVIVETWL